MKSEQSDKNPADPFPSSVTEKCFRKIIVIATSFLVTIPTGKVFAFERQTSSSQPATQKAPGGVRSTVEAITGMQTDSELELGETQAETAKNSKPPQDPLDQVASKSQSFWTLLQKIIDIGKPTDVEGSNSPETTARERREAKREPEKEIQKTAGERPVVTNMFFDTPIRQALADIAAQTGVIILPDISVQGIVTCELQDVPIERALEIVLSSGNFAFRQMDGYILVGSIDAESPSFSRLSETYRMKMNYVKAEEAVKMLSDSAQTYAKANVTSNTVSITAPAELLERIISNLRLIDQPLRHVMLDARVVALERGDLLNLGIQWNWPGISAGTFSDSEHHGGGAPERVNWPWGIQIGYTPGLEFTNSLMMTLNLLAENHEATVIASPQVLAQDGQEAEIKVVTEEYFKISQESYMYTRFELETIETGTTLTITPRIGDNNEITLEIVTEVSDVIARGDDNLPVVTRRTTKNTVRIENGGTATVAGLMDTRKRSEKSRAPGLASLPLVGGLFRNTNEIESARHVSVFITARLMPETGLHGPGTIEERIQIAPAGEEFRKALEESLSLMNAKRTMQ